MLQKFIDKILRRHHYWRSIGFDELSELYTAQLLRSLGISLIGLFTPVYLYKIGYSLSEIAIFHVSWFMVRPLFDLLSAFIIARVGPKHTMLLSSFVHITYLGLVITIEDLRWPLALVAMFGSFAYGLHVLAIMVDFSKIKHPKHGGKELGVLEIMQRVGGMAGPLIGGLIANFYDPRYTIGLAMMVLLGSTIPLFLTSEPVRTKQKIQFQGLNYRRHIRDYISVIPLTIENAISMLIWPIYAAIFLLGDDTFAKLGIIAALSTLAALVVTHLIGALIDNRKGRQLMRVSLIGNAFVHLARITAKGPLSVLAINLANEPLTAGYRMPYMKGLFDASDSVPGYRIAYLTSIAITDAISRLLLWVSLWIALQFLPEQNAIQIFFVVAALASFAIMSEKFEALKSRA